MANDAQVTVGADASAVERAAAAAKNAWEGAADALRTAVGSAARSVVSSLADVALSAGKVNFAAQHEQVKAFEASTARLAVSMGRDLEGVRSEFEQTGKAIGKRPQEVAAWASEVGKLTYNFDGATKAITGLSGLAATTGRSVEDYRGLAVELANVGAAAGDTTHVIGVMAAQADRLGVKGGVAAFTDQIEGLSGAISQFAVNSERDFTKVTALAGELGKGLSPQAAQRVQQGAFGAIASDPLRWERFLGKQFTYEHGHVKDPAAVMQEISDKVKKRYGQDARRVMMLNFGAETGAAMYSANYQDAAKAAGIAATASPQDKQRELAQTDAGKRAQADAQLAVSSRDLMGSSTKLGQAADALQRFAASNPISSTVIAGSISGALSLAMSKMGGSIGAMISGRAVDVAAGGGRSGVGGAGGSLAIGGAILGAGLYGISKFEEAGEERHRLQEETGVAEQRNRLMLRQKAQRDRVSLLEAGGLDHGRAVYAAQEISSGRIQGGAAGQDPKEFARAVTEALKKAEFKVVNMTSPVEVSAQSSQSVSAGNQSGG